MIKRLLDRMGGFDEALGYGYMAAIVVIGILAIAIFVRAGFNQRAIANAQSVEYPQIIGAWAQGDDAFTLYYLNRNVYLLHYRNGTPVAEDSFSVQCDPKIVSAVADGVWVNVFVACPGWVDGLRIGLPVDYIQTARRYFSIYLPMVLND